MPNFSGKDMVDLLERAGFKVVRTRGDHVSLHKGTSRTVVPLHKELARGTIGAILRQAEISREEFNRLRNE
jgi:predicted RNA binding protein YcfA (HicA-like mRNA interferase family)